MVKSAFFQRIVRATISSAVISAAVFGARVRSQVCGDDAPATGRKQSSTTMTGSRAGQTRNDNGLKTTLVWIPPGDFTMGSPKTEWERSEDEKQVQVSLSNGFWLGQHEVTEAEWRQVMRTTPWFVGEHVGLGNDYPATYVSWNDAMKFCQTLTETERQAGRLPSDWQYSLPTEAQWEYACRAGTKSRFSFGADYLDLKDYGWWGGLLGDGSARGEQYAHRVGQKKANPWGLRDMHGNVWEWCRDVYANELGGGTDPQGPSTGQYRVDRGGSWFFSARFCRSAYRGKNVPDHRDHDVGFRIAAVPSVR